MKKSDESVQCFLNGFNCAQAVLSTYSKQLGLEQEMALKVAGGFGGGMGMIGEACGAVTGALMLIGLKYGKVKTEDYVAKGKTYGVVQEFAHKFKELHGSVQCNHLLGCDIGTPEGIQKAKDHKLFTTICPKLVRDASEIIEDLLELNGECDDI